MWREDSRLCIGLFRDALLLVTRMGHTGWLVDKSGVEFFGKLSTKVNLEEVSHNKPKQHGYNPHLQYLKLLELITKMVYFKRVMNWEIKILLIFWHISRHSDIKTFCAFLELKTFSLF